MPDGLDAIEDVLEGKTPATVVPLERTVEKRAYLFLSDPRTGQSQSLQLTGDGEQDTILQAMWAAALEMESGEPARIGLAGKSEQIPLTSSAQLLFVDQSKVILPPYDPGLLVSIYYDDPDYRAAVDDRVAAVAGLGYKINPRPDLEGKPDAGQKSRLLKLLEEPDADGQSACDILQMAYRDWLTQGAGYLEVDLTRKALLRGFMYAPSLATRPAVDGKSYYQVVGNETKVFRSLTAALAERPYAVMRPDGLVHRFVTPGERERFVQGEERFGLADAPSTKAERQRATVVTHCIMPIHRQAPTNRYYEVPPIVNGFRDYQGATYARKYNVNFFDNSTVPPLIVICKGENLGPDQTLALKTAITQNRGKDAFHKTCYLELPQGAEIEIMPLRKEMVNDAGFLDYLETCSTSIHKVMRTPRTLHEVMKGVGGDAIKAANRQFVDLVAAVDQATINHRMNRLFRKFLGITDWVFGLGVLNLEDALTQAQIDDIYLRRAVDSVNDVLGQQGRPPKKGGDHPTLTVPGIGVLILEAADELSRRVLAGESARDVLMPRGAKTPGKGSPVIEPSKSKPELDGELEAAGSEVGLAEPGWLPILKPENE